jgi:hypothetical protein
MSVEVVRRTLLWCTVLNYVLLLVWAVVLALPHRWMYRLYGRWFRLSDEQFDALSFALIGLYKLGILLFNLVPYVALCIVT